MKKFNFSLFLILFFLTSLTGLVVKPQVVRAEDGCGGPVPPAPVGVWAKSGPGAGQVTLYWQAAPHANRYAIAYGTKSNKYMYGADNVGNTTWYTVKYLSPGTKYYFRVAAARDCSSSPFSAEFSAVAMGGQVVMPQATQAVAKAPSTPMMPKVGYGPVGKHGLWAKSGPRAGEVTLYWKHAEDANNYHLVYGKEPGKYMYGATNIGWVTWYTVRLLSPGTTYYFALVPVKNDVALYTTDAVRGTAASGYVSMPPPAGAAVGLPKAVAPTTAGPVGKQMLWGKPGPKVGEVTLYWQHTDSADNYHLVYGLEHGKFIYGALNIGKVNWFTVRGLVPGKLYHLALVPVMNNMAMYTTDQVMVYAKGWPVQVVQTTPDALIQPKPKAAVPTSPPTGGGTTSTPSSGTGY